MEAGRGRLRRLKFCRSQGYRRSTISLSASWKRSKPGMSGLAPAGGRWRLIGFLPARTTLRMFSALPGACVRLSIRWHVLDVLPSQQGLYSHEQNHHGFGLIQSTASCSRQILPQRISAPIKACFCCHISLYRCFLDNGLNTSPSGVPSLVTCPPDAFTSPVRAAFAMLS